MACTASFASEPQADTQGRRADALTEARLAFDRHRRLFDEPAQACGLADTVTTVLTPVLNSVLPVQAARHASATRMESNAVRILDA